MRKLFIPITVKFDWICYLFLARNIIFHIRLHKGIHKANEIKFKILFL